jgi:hypothetical protein
VDVAPKQKTTPRQKVAQLVRLFGTTERGERVSAWRALERTMEGAGVSWSDVGNWIEQGSEHDNGKYNEVEMQEFAQAARAEGVETGIKIGETRIQGQQQSNGHIILPKPSEMAEYCHERPHRLKDDKQREFIDEMYAKTQRGISLQLGTPDTWRASTSNSVEGSNDASS